MREDDDLKRATELSLQGVLKFGSLDTPAILLTDICRVIEQSCLERPFGAAS